MRKICFFVIFLVGAATLEATSSQPVCLNMIVKDESAVIKRCLASVKPLIDYWVIVDTGSKDGTQEIIKEYLKDVPGELHERHWRNFAENRNEALQLAQGKGAYFLFMDADDWMEYDSKYQLPYMTHDRYSVWRVGLGYSFLNYHFVRADLPWRWVGVVHEYLCCDKQCSSSTLEHIVYRIGNDGSSHNDQQKFIRYCALLEESLKKDPHNDRDLFSLAKSYKAAGQSEKSAQLYEKIVASGAQGEVLFWAMMELGELYRTLKRPLKDVLMCYYRAHRISPLRVEPFYSLSHIYNDQGSYDLAYVCIKRWQALSLRNQKGAFFNMDWMQEYGVLFEFSLCSFYVGDYQQSLNACDQLLSMQNLPARLRRRTEENRQFPLAKIKRAPIYGVGVGI